MDETLDRVIKAIPLQFFTLLDEGINAAFFDACKHTKEHYAVPEQTAMIGQTRHAFCEEAFRSAADHAGLESFAITTKPKGGSYSLVESNGVHLLRSNIQTHTGLPRATSFRSEYAAFNEYLQPLQLDLFKEVAPKNKDCLCAMIVTTSHKNNQNKPDVPAFVGLGIPNHNLSAWHIILPLHILYAKYNDKKLIINPIVEKPVVIKDKAIPKLKEVINNDQ